MNTPQQNAATEWSNLKDDIKQKMPIAIIDDNINLMHRYYGVHEAISKLDKESLKAFIKFRFDFLQEEVTEGITAIEEGNADEIVDSLIDLIVVAVGTLDCMNVNFDRAWFEVLKANMNKHVGIKASRPNSLGLPDLIKSADWVAPSHKNNLGLFETVFQS